MFVGVCVWYIVLYHMHTLRANSTEFTSCLRISYSVSGTGMPWQTKLGGNVEILQYVSGSLLELSALAVSDVPDAERPFTQ